MKLPQIKDGAVRGVKRRTQERDQDGCDLKVEKRWRNKESEERGRERDREKEREMQLREEQSAEVEQTNLAFLSHNQYELVLIAIM